MPDLSNIVPKGMSLRAIYQVNVTRTPSIWGFTGDLGLRNFALQSDGKIIACGAFTIWNFGAAGYIVRLNSDGTQDQAFTAANGTGGNATMWTTAVQSDGKILAGGQMTSWNGTTVGRIVRLNSDGTIDTAFTTANGTGADNHIYKIYVQSDGKILVSGAFTSWNGTTVGGIVRLNSDGSLDTAFTTANGTGGVGTIQDISLQSDGKILVANPTSWNGTAVGHLVRLDTSGAIDSTFNTSIGTGSTSTVYSVQVQSDGKILVGGGFSSWDGTTVGRIVRLNSDGTRDTAFTTATGAGASSTVYDTAVQSDGKILVGGTFGTWDSTYFLASFVRISSSGSVVGEYEIPVDVVFAVVVGAGGGGGRPSSSTVHAGGGGGGAIVWGMVPVSGSIVVGNGGSGNGGSSRFSTLYAEGGRVGAIATAVDSSNGEGGGGGTASTSTSLSGGIGSTIFASVGGSGGAGKLVTGSSATGNAGQSGTSGGGGGATYVGTAAFSSVGGNGGSGFTGGGGGASGSVTINLSTGGVGGDSIFGYTGGAGASTTGAATGAGGGGAGILGNGSDATTAGAGGSGGRGGGGGGAAILSGTIGTGGDGCVLIYW